MGDIIELGGETDLLPNLMKIVEGFHGRIDITYETLRKILDTLIVESVYYSWCISCWIGQFKNFMMNIEVQTRAILNTK